MQTYDRSGTKTLTRASALKCLARGDDQKPLLSHPNYHVRCAAWKGLGMPIPESVALQVDLFKSVAPNLAARCAARKGHDERLTKESNARIKAATDHNAAALLFLATDEDPIRFRVITEWVAAADEARRVVDANAEIAAWLDARTEVPIPEAYMGAIPFENYAQLFASSNATGQIFLNLPGLVAALPSA